MTGSITLTEEERKYWFNRIIETHTPYQLLAELARFIDTDQPPEWCEWTREGAWIRSPHGRMIAKSAGYEVKVPAYCEDCGKPVREGGK